MERILHERMSKLQQKLYLVGLRVFSSILILSGVFVLSPPIAPAHTIPLESYADHDKVTSTCGLTWYPPELHNPVILNVEPTERIHLFEMDTNTDYVIQMPQTPVPGGIYLVGGHNIVLIGGHITIPWQGDGAYIRARTMLTIRGATGTVHIEGLLGDGPDISEGIQIDAPEAIIQIQNVRIENIHARDQSNFTDNHPDLIQVYGNARKVRIDRFTGSSDYQGLMFQVDHNGPQSEIHVRRTNIIGTPTARYLFWVSPHAEAARIVLQNVWISVPSERDGGLARAVWPDARGGFPNQAQINVDHSGVNFATWPPDMVPYVEGRINQGLPPVGDFVTREDVGVGYVSPGYAGDSASQDCLR